MDWRAVSAPRVEPVSTYCASGPDLAGNDQRKRNTKLAFHLLASYRPQGVRDVRPASLPSSGFRPDLASAGFQTPHPCPPRTGLRPSLPPALSHFFPVSAPLLPARTWPALPPGAQAPRVRPRLCPGSAPALPSSLGPRPHVDGGERALEALQLSQARRPGSCPMGALQGTGCSGREQGSSEGTGGPACPGLGAPGASGSPWLCHSSLMGNERLIFSSPTG